MQYGISEGGDTVIFYRIEIQFAEAFIEQDEQTDRLRRNYYGDKFSNLNTLLVDEYLEKRINALFLIADYEDDHNILVYCAYNSDVLNEGYICVPEDIVHAMNFIKLPEISTMNFQEISASEFDRALSRYSLTTMV